jgi:enoyl-CoA hydratase/carnithine racemase
LSTKDESGFSSPVAIEQRGRIAIVSLNRPAQRNAMSAALVGALIDALDRFEHDADIGAILLKGAGRGFCAGSDLAMLAAMDAAQRMRFEADSGRLARAIGHCRCPVVAAVHGFAIGGGLTLAAACDVVVTTPDAKWCLPEVPIGLFPAWGLGAVIARTGMPAARRICWGIDTLSGQAAQDIGLADLVAVDAEAEALAQAEQLAALPRAQAGMVKRYFASLVADEQADAAANRLFHEATQSPEALASFAKFDGR